MTERPKTIEERMTGIPPLGLSGKLLVLTILFVMLAEVLIYVPSIANFRLTWLADRLAVARTVALVLEAKNAGVPSEGPAALADSEKDTFKLPDKVIEQILDNLGAQTVA